MRQIFLLFIFLTLTSQLFCDNTGDQKINNFIKSDTNYKFGRYEATTAIYWSTKATVGLTSFFACFGFLNNQLTLSDDIRYLTTLLKSNFNLDLKTVNNLATIYHISYLGYTFDEWHCQYPGLWWLNLWFTYDNHIHWIHRFKINRSTKLLV